MSLRYEGGSSVPTSGSKDRTNENLTKNDQLEIAIDDLKSDRFDVNQCLIKNKPRFWDVLCCRKPKKIEIGHELEQVIQKYVHHIPAVPTITFLKHVRQTITHKINQNETLLQSSHTKEARILKKTEKEQQRHAFLEERKEIRHSRQDRTSKFKKRDE